MRSGGTTSAGTEGHPASGASHWRDARLARALQEAPDASLQPSPAARRAILQAAAQAVAPVARVPWWRRGWQAAGQRSLPWNAALATVVLATLITVLWREQEVPPAKSEAAPAAQTARVSPPGLPAAAPAAASEAADALAPALAAATGASEKSKAASAAGASRALPETQAPRATQARPREQVLADRSPEPALAAAAPRRDEGVLSKSAPAAQAAPQGEAQLSRRSDASVLSSAAPAAAAGSATTAAASAPQARESLARHSAWDGARLEWADGRRADLTRAQAARLAPHVAQLIASADRNDQPAGPAQLRMLLVERGVAVGTLEVGHDAVSWTPAGGVARSGRPDPVLVRSLLSEASPLAPR